MSPLFSRRPGRQAIPRSTAGVGLVELMVVVTIISMLMALALPSYQRIQQKARSAAISNDFRVFTAVLQARAHENGSWPAETAAGVVPDVITKDDIQMALWIGPTSIGGRFDWDNNQIHTGIRYRAALALVDTADAPLLEDLGLYQEIDTVLDDGNLATGNFRLGQDNCLLFIIEP
ncbi:MAG: type II secretion system protein [Opitutae bacterium]|nr:type II secretion system protein [Opitutae bacterium]